MFYFTKYANNKFELLNKYKVFFTKEQVEDAVKAPDKVKKKGNYFICHKDGVGAIYRKEDEAIRVITFYPIK